jgi:hypothetical protein
VIFKRRAKADPAAPIQAFWTWWETARPRAEKMIAGTPDDALVDELSRRVSAIDPGLEWEFTAGREAAHQLVVTSAGDVGLRSLAERWRRAAPPADGTFGYASARQGNPAALTDASLEIAGRRIDLSELRFEAATDEPDAQPSDAQPSDAWPSDAQPSEAQPGDVRPSVVHVTVWHPVFPGLPVEAQMQVAFLALDWVLGEDVVEIWVGVISTTDQPGPTLAAPELAAVVTGIIPSGDQPLWSTMAGTRKGKPLVALVQTPLKAARWPAYDLHIRVDVPYRSRDENGLPAEEAFPALYALEDRIDARVDGAVVVAHETSNGIRTTHLYADRPAAAAVLEPLLVDWPDGRIRMKVTPDPRWDAVSHLTR